MLRYLSLLLLFLMGSSRIISAEDLFNSPLTHERVDAFMSFVRTMRTSPHTRPAPNATKNAVFDQEFERALSSWRDAFLCTKKEYAKRLDQMKAINMAREAARKYMPFVVCGVYEAFQNTVELKKKTIKIGNMTTLTCPGDSFMQIIAENDPYFATYISLIRLIVGEDQYRMMRQAPGLNNELCMGWVNDSRSILPFSWDKRMSTRPYYNPLPYMELSRGLQHAVFIQNGKICEKSGIFMQDQSDERGVDNSIKFIGQHGAPHFDSERTTIRMSRNCDFVAWYMEDLIRGDKTREEAIQMLSNGVFFEFPETPEEEPLFQAVLSEEIREVGLLTAPVIPVLEALEEEEDSGRAPLTPEALQDSPVGKSVESFYLYALQIEWQKRQEAVAQGAVPGKMRTPQPKKSKGKAGAAAAAATAPVEAVVVQPSFTPPPEALEQIRQRGRMKYRQLARLIAEALKTQREGLSINVVKSGSHFNLHISTNGGEALTGGVTLIRMHGKQDRTVSANEVLGLVGQVQRLLQMASATQQVALSTKLPSGGVRPE